MSLPLATKVDAVSVRVIVLMIRFRMKGEIMPRATPEKRRRADLRKLGKESGCQMNGAK